MIPVLYWLFSLFSFLFSLFSFLCFASDEWENVLFNKILKEIVESLDPDAATGACGKPGVLSKSDVYDLREKNKNSAQVTTSKVDMLIEKLVSDYWLAYEGMTTLETTARSSKIVLGIRACAELEPVLRENCGECALTGQLAVINPVACEHCGTRYWRHLKARVNKCKNPSCKNGKPFEEIA